MENKALKRNCDDDFKMFLNSFLPLDSRKPLATPAAHEGYVPIRSAMLSADRDSVPITTANGEPGKSKAATRFDEPPSKHTVKPGGDRKANVPGKKTRVLTEQERVDERNRKGRERSMKTRRRNANRLISLQESCAYLHKENGVLRQIVISVRDNPDWSIVRSLLGTLAVFRSRKPPSYVFASKDAESAAYQGRGQNLLFNTLAIQDTLSQALKPASITATNLIGNASTKKKDVREADDTMSTNDQENTGSTREAQPLEGDVGDLFARLNRTFSFKLEDLNESDQNLETTPRLTYEEIAKFVGNTIQ